MLPGMAGLLIPGKWITTSKSNPRFNLSGNTVISEFCHMEGVMRQVLKEKAKELECNIPNDIIYELRKYAGDDDNIGE